MTVGIYGVDQAIENQIVQEVTNNGAHFIKCRPISSHPADHYLQVVWAQRPDGTYITWIHNSSTGGLQLGHYQMTYQQSFDDFLTR